jgi:hypothetical protein
MGMFDYINFETECPKCGMMVGNFQSKDAACLRDLIDPDEVYTFYSFCAKCGNWIQFSRHIPEEKPRKARENPFTKPEVEALGFKMVKGL